MKLFNNNQTIFIKEICIICLCAFIGIFISFLNSIASIMATELGFYSSLKIPYTFFWLISYLASLKIRSDLE